MNSDYQLWLTYNGGTEKIRFPVLPEVINVNEGGASQSMRIQGLGEVVIKQDPDAAVISWKSFFPAAPFPGVQVENLTRPQALKEKITAWMNSDLPAQVILTGTNLNLFCRIENFSTYEEGGDIGTIHYNIALKHYKTVKVRQIQYNAMTKVAIMPDPPKTQQASTSLGSARVDNRVQPKTYTVVTGDSLSKIAQKTLGSGSRWPEIYELNKSQIKNPNLIFPGQVFKLP